MFEPGGEGQGPESGPLDHETTDSAQEEQANLGKEGFLGTHAETKLESPIKTENPENPQAADSQKVPVGPQNYTEQPKPVVSQEQRFQPQPVEGHRTIAPTTDYTLKTLSERQRDVAENMAKKGKP
jgi:hypothetical protein